MFQNFFERMFIVILHIIKWLFILVLCCASIIIGAVILAIMGIEVPNVELIVNVASVPIMLFGVLFDNKIVQVIIHIFIIIILVLLAFLIKKNEKIT
ncbi:hypothetical protein [Viridibacillus arvi]|uniref:hypothetical protein n=1 Tax=Viridibacillus arvi TaxID=263475 RepID=UPI0036E4FDE0